MTNSFLLLFFVVLLTSDILLVASKKVDGLLHCLALRGGLALGQHVLDQAMIGNGSLRLIEDWIELPNRCFLDLFGFVLEQVDGPSFLFL